MNSQGYFTRLSTNVPCPQCGHTVIRIDEFPKCRRVLCLNCLDETYVNDMTALPEVVARALFTIEQCHYQSVGFSPEQDVIAANATVRQSSINFQSDKHGGRISVRWFYIQGCRDYYYTNKVKGWTLRLRHAPQGVLWMLGELTRANMQPGGLSLREASANRQIAGRHSVRLEQNYRQAHADWTLVLRIEMSWDHTPTTGVEPDSAWPRYSEFGNLMPQPGSDVDPMSTPPFPLGGPVGRRP